MLPIGLIILILSSYLTSKGLSMALISLVIKDIYNSGYKFKYNELNKMIPIIFRNNELDRFIDLFPVLNVFNVILNAYNYIQQKNDFLSIFDSCGLLEKDDNKCVEVHSKETGNVVNIRFFRGIRHLIGRKKTNNNNIAEIERDDTKCRYYPVSNALENGLIPKGLNYTEDDLCVTDTESRLCAKKFYKYFLDNGIESCMLNISFYVRYPKLNDNYTDQDCRSRCCQLVNYLKKAMLLYKPIPKYVVRQCLKNDYLPKTKDNVIKVSLCGYNDFVDEENVDMNSFFDELEKLGYGLNIEQLRELFIDESMPSDINLSYDDYKADLFKNYIVTLFKKGVFEIPIEIVKNPSFNLESKQRVLKK